MVSYVHKLWAMMVNAVTFTFIKNDLLIIEENNKNMVILYRKHKYLVEHTGINTYVARAEENLPAREHKKDTQNFVLIKADKKDRIKNNKSQATV